MSFQILIKTIAETKNNLKTDLNLSCLSSDVQNPKSNYIFLCKCATSGPKSIMV